MSSAHATPSGYQSFEIRGARVVAHRDHAAAIRSAMAEFSLHEWARNQLSAQPMRGRAIAYGTTLADSTAIVVRHSQHGGMFAPITGDLFLRPTRAPHELATAMRLAASGVRTPKVVAYAVYPAFPPFARADVATERLYGRAFPDAWESADTDAERDEMIDAVVELLRALRRAKAQHPDLNARNILILDGSPIVAAVLDVDRIEFPATGEDAVAAANAARLLRSLTGERLGLGRELDGDQIAAIQRTGAPA